MADDNEDTLLASMKEAIAAEKSEKEPETAEEPEKEPDTEQDEEEDKEPEKNEDTPDKEPDVDEEDEEPTRGQTRHQKLANQLKEEREERAKERVERDTLIAERATYAAQLEQIKQQQHAGQSAEARRAEQERLSLLSPEELNSYNANQKASQLEYRLNQMELQRQDDNDRSTFRSKGSTDPLVEKYGDKVEQMLQEDRKKGFSASRDSYLNFIVGEAIRKDASTKLSAKKEAAGKRINSVTSKSATARGDVSGTKSDKGDSLEALEARLRNITF